MKTAYFEDIIVGQEYQTALSEPFTRAMIDEYFSLTGDRFNIHRDDRFAKYCGLRAAMVPGNLVVAVATGLVYEAGYFTDSLVVQARKDVRFHKPLYVDERIHVVEHVVEVDDRPAKKYGRVVLRRKVFNDHDEMIQSVEQDYRILKYSAACEMNAAPLSTVGEAS